MGLGADADVGAHTSAEDLAKRLPTRNVEGKGEIYVIGTDTWDEIEHSDEVMKAMAGAEFIWETVVLLVYFADHTDEIKAPVYIADASRPYQETARGGYGGDGGSGGSGGAGGSVLTAKGDANADGGRGARGARGGRGGKPGCGGTINGERSNQPCGDDVNFYDTYGFRHGGFQSTADDEEEESCSGFLSWLLDVDCWIFNPATTIFV